jgi:hypothetical protein
MPEMASISKNDAAEEKHVHGMEDKRPLAAISHGDVVLPGNCSSHVSSLVTDSGEAYQSSMTLLHNANGSLSTWPLHFATGLAKATS